jgi:hypothetical protein
MLEAELRAAGHQALAGTGSFLSRPAGPRRATIRQSLTDRSWDRIKPPPKLPRNVGSEHRLRCNPLWIIRSGVAHWGVIRLSPWWHHCSSSRHGPTSSADEYRTKPFPLTDCGAEPSVELQSRFSVGVGQVQASRSHCRYAWSAPAFCRRLDDR